MCQTRIRESFLRTRRITSARLKARFCGTPLSFMTPDSNNNSTSWGVLERRTSDRNYEKMTSLIKSKSDNLTSLTKSKSKSTATNHYYDDESEIIERISPRQPVNVASE